MLLLTSDYPEPRTRLVRGEGVAVWNTDSIGGNPPPPTEFSVQFVFDPLLKGVERELIVTREVIYRQS